MDGAWGLLWKNRREGLNVLICVVFIIHSTLLKDYYRGSKVTDRTAKHRAQRIARTISQHVCEIISKANLPFESGVFPMGSCFLTTYLPTCESKFWQQK